MLAKRVVEHPAPARLGQVAQAQEVQPRLDRDRDARTPAAWMIAGARTTRQDVPADDPRVAEPGDAGGVDVQLVADCRDRAEDARGRRPGTIKIPKITMDAQIDGPITARAASSTTMPGRAINRLVVSRRTRSPTACRSSRRPVPR